MAFLLATALLPLLALASPTALPETGPMLSQRSSPTFGDIGDTPGVNITQIKDAFQDACTLAKAARDAVSFVRDHRSGQLI